MIKFKVKEFNYIEPHDEVREFILASYKGRSFNLGDLPLRVMFCAWCRSHHGIKRRKYCGEDCAQSAMIFCWPQIDSSKYFHFKRQGFICLECGLDYSSFIEKKLNSWGKINERRHIEFSRNGEFDGVVYPNQILDNTGHIIQVDHIKPIFLGGVAIGIDNIQVICSEPCHKNKTLREKSKK